MELTLGPILFEWKKQDVIEFYDEVAGMPVDRVYLGEVVCSKKLGLGLKDAVAIARRLEAAGKKVALSTLAVVSNDEELELTRSVCGAWHSIEANDMSAIAMLEGQDITAGPHITSYNAESVGFLMTVGVGRACFPVEMSGAAIGHAVKSTGVVAEVFAHGKLPLAFSWRCYTSRAHGLTKSECRHDCAAYPDGMEIKTLAGEPLFTINGTSVLSAATHTLVASIDEARSAGISALRISPQKNGTASAAKSFRSAIEGKIGADEAVAEIKSVCPGPICNGWYKGAPGKDWV